MQNREYMFSSEHVIQNRESTSHLRVCESRTHPVSIVGWIHLQHTRIAVAFARWNLLLLRSYMTAYR